MFSISIFFQWASLRLQVAAGLSSGSSSSAHDVVLGEEVHVLHRRTRRLRATERREQKSSRAPCRAQARHEADAYRRHPLFDELYRRKLVHCHSSTVVFTGRMFLGV
jgi:hypothetical protein